MKISTSYEDYKKTQIGVDSITLGDHCGIIKKAYEQQSKKGNQMIVIEFDFSSADVQEGLIERKSEGLDGWHSSGKYYIVLDNDYTLTNIKKLATALEKSNNGYKWVKETKGGIDVDLEGVANKEVGLCFGQEEYEITQGEHAGEIGKVNKLRYFKDLNKVDYGENIPPLKTLNGSSTSANASMDSDGFNKIEGDENDLPFV